MIRQSSHLLHRTSVALRIISAVLVVLSSTNTLGAEHSPFVGTWYSEYKEAGTYGSMNYDMFRVLGHVRRDGSFLAIHRFYKDNQLQVQDDDCQRQDGPMRRTTGA
jgi:hypothetical protein